MKIKLQKIVRNLLDKRRAMTSTVPINSATPKEMPVLPVLWCVNQFIGNTVEALLATTLVSDQLWLWPH